MLLPKSMSTKSVLLVFLLLLMFNLGGTLNLFADTYEADTISMFAMNSATAVKRIDNGFFSVIYRGFGSRKVGEIDRDELLGFRFLLDISHQSRGLRNLIEENQKAGLSPEAALRNAKTQQTKILQKIFATMDSRKELYENRHGKFAASKTGVPDAETHFLFTSPRIDVAKLYGPIILVIQETRPRGMDLNSIARDARYYSLSRFLKNIGNADFKLILADYVADRDEYVIPSYIIPADASGLIVYSPSPMVVGNRIAVPPPVVRRVYRKHQRQGALTIDVFDGKDRLIERLCAAPSATGVESDQVLSPDKLPTFIRDAWNKYVQSIRKGGGR